MRAGSFQRWLGGSRTWRPLITVFDPPGQDALDQAAQGVESRQQQEQAEWASSIDNRYGSSLHCQQDPRGYDTGGNRARTGAEPAADEEPDASSHAELTRYAPGVMSLVKAGGAEQGANGGGRKQGHPGSDTEEQPSERRGLGKPLSGAELGIGPADGQGARQREGNASEEAGPDGRDPPSVDQAECGEREDGGPNSGDK